MSTVYGDSPSSQCPKSKRCLVEGCTEIITREEAYYYRNSLCRTHLKAPRLLVDGITQRFCQQCTTFHPLSEFDGARRSCRIKLAHQSALRRARYRDASVRSDSGEASSHRLGSPTSESTASAAEDAAGTVGEGLWLQEALHRTGSVMSARGAPNSAATGASRLMPPEAMPTASRGVARDDMMIKSTIGTVPMTPIRVDFPPIIESTALLQERFSVSSSHSATVVNGFQMVGSSVTSYGTKSGSTPKEGSTASGCPPDPSRTTRIGMYEVDAGAEFEEKAMVFSSLTYPVPARVVTTGTPSRYERTTQPPALETKTSHHRPTLKRAAMSQMPPPESPPANYIARLPITSQPDPSQPMQDVRQQIPTTAAENPPITSPTALAPSFYPSGHMGMPQSPGERWTAGSTSSKHSSPATPPPPASTSACKDMRQLPTPGMPFPHTSMAPIEWWMGPHEVAAPTPSSMDTMSASEECPAAQMVATKGFVNDLRDSQKCMDFDLPSSDGLYDNEAEFRGFLSSLMDSPPGSPAVGFL